MDKASLTLRYGYRQPAEPSFALSVLIDDALNIGDIGPPIMIDASICSRYDGGRVTVIAGRARASLCAIARRRAIGHTSALAASELVQCAFDAFGDFGSRRRPRCGGASFRAGGN